MAFVSDGKRTWDPEQGFELKRTKIGQDYESFELSGPSGKLYFFGEWSAYKVEKHLRFKDQHNQNANNVLEWLIYLDDLMPSLNKDETKALILAAMTSFETGYGLDSLNGHPLRSVTCRYKGRQGGD